MHIDGRRGEDHSPRCTNPLAEARSWPPPSWLASSRVALSMWDSQAGVEASGPDRRSRIRVLLGQSRYGGRQPFRDLRFERRIQG